MVIELFSILRPAPNALKDIQDQVGHKDSATTLRIYAQVTTEGKQKVVDLVNFSEPAGEMVELPKVQKK